MSPMTIGYHDKRQVTFANVMGDITGEEPYAQETIIIYSSFKETCLMSALEGDLFRYA